jgi:hypothetical protein
MNKVFCKNCRHYTDVPYRDDGNTCTFGWPDVENKNFRSRLEFNKNNDCPDYENVDRYLRAMNTTMGNSSMM